MTAMKFTYRSGQRPLDGFTLKRGVGQGGFGEVYFAVSDGGKEVALKLLRGHTDAELRGIGHCLNLKHPNLVHLYDLRTDSRGEKWVVMEYVFGESLAQVGGVEILSGGEVDAEAVRRRLEERRETLRAEVSRAEGKLANRGFTSNAPAEVVESERRKLADYRAELEELGETT